MSSQDPFKNPPRPADADRVDEIEASMRQLLDRVVDGVPGVLGALVSSADGFTLASRLPAGADDASIAAMSAALLGLAGQLVRTIGREPVRVGQLRSGDAQVFVFSIAGAASLAVFAEPTSDGRQLAAVGRETTLALARLFRGTAGV